MPSYGDFLEQARRNREGYYQFRGEQAEQVQNPMDRIMALQKAAHEQIGEETRAIGNPWAAYPPVRFAMGGSLEGLRSSPILGSIETDPTSTFNTNQAGPRPWGTGGLTGPTANIPTEQLIGLSRGGASSAALKGLKKVR